MMTKDEMRIAIAEKCGAVWKRQSCGPWYPDDESKNLYFRRLYFIEPGDIRGPALLPDAHGSEMIADDNPIPNYPEDLNAMHEAEKLLTTQFQCGKFANELAILVKGYAHDPFLGVISYIWHSTAVQRAEAFCRVFWPERFKD